MRLLLLSIFKNRETKNLDAMQLFLYHRDIVVIPVH
jgi:hypothetical protein